MQPPRVEKIDSHKVLLYKSSMRIPGIVIFVHVLIIACLLYLRTPQPKSKPRTPVKVQTYVVQEQTPKPQPVVQPKSQPQPTPKPAAVPKPVVKKSAPKPTSEPNRDKLVQMMQQSLASLDTKPADSKPTTPSKKIGALASEALTFETAYQDRLITFLENALTLPEKGDVKITLTLNRTGGVKSVSVKQTASQRNRTYVESALPSLLLPPFKDNFKGESAHTFSITLTSS